MSDNPTTNEGMRERVKARLADLGASPITLAKQYGLERGFINDFLIGRKNTIRGTNLSVVAEALDCDVAYLEGTQDVPRLVSPPPAADTKGPLAARMKVAGIAEAGVWREQGADEAEADVFVPFDPRYPVDRIAYLARGHGADNAGINDGEFIVCLDYKGYSNLFGVPRIGSLCVVQRTIRELQIRETSIRRCDMTDRGLGLVSPIGGEAIPLEDVDNVDVRIAGVVERAVRMFI